MPKKENLEGQIFNLIKVVSPAENKGGKTYWNCECVKCGSQKIIQTTHIKNGSIKTCGCGCSLIEEGRERQCPICNSTFYIKGAKDNGRKYCYTCSPENRGGNYVPLYNAMKKRMIELKGGKCEICGYNKCIAALTFHHIDPNEKDFALSMKSGSCNWEKFSQEAAKCRLLCSNCHLEYHWNQNHMDCS